MFMHSPSISFTIQYTSKNILGCFSPGGHMPVVYHISLCNKHPEQSLLCPRTQGRPEEEKLPNSESTSISTLEIQNILILKPLIKVSFSNVPPQPQHIFVYMVYFLLFIRINLFILIYLFMKLHLFLYMHLKFQILSLLVVHAYEAYHSLSESFHPSLNDSVSQP